MPPAATNATYKIWAAGLFVATVFIVLWGTAVLRLMQHANGEAFLHGNGALDSALALIAPLAVAARLWQMIVLLRKGRSA
jgi:hypothetical protein